MSEPDRFKLFKLEDWLPTCFPLLIPPPASSIGAFEPSHCHANRQLQHTMMCVCVKRNVERTFESVRTLLCCSFALASPIGRCLGWRDAGEVGSIITPPILTYLLCAAALHWWCNLESSSSTSVFLSWPRSQPLQSAPLTSLLSL